VYGGDGLSRLDGEVVFTPFVLPGEAIEAERTLARQHVQRSRLVRVAEPSPVRVVPPCPVFGRCGGCHYQHASYEAQLRFKRDILAETLRRVGKIEFDAERIGTEAGEPFGYRNRAQFHFERGRAGYREMNSRNLVETGQCPISSPKINEIIPRLNRMVRDRRWPDFMGSLEVFTDERQVQWNALESERPVAKRFFDWLADEVPGTVAGALEYAVNDDRFTVSGTSFFQVNRFLLPRLAGLAIGDAGGATAWDLYAGAGLFSLPLARRFERVVAVEAGRGVEDLRHNAKRAGLKIHVIADQVEVFLAATRNPPDFVLSDPPRAGLGKAASARLLALRPATLVIVSCDPATLARDLAILAPAYDIERITMVDLFPQTFHMEAIVKLLLKK
jgi:23S rRNA (uracil1939-C5)-methyltransferase